MLFNTREIVHEWRLYWSQSSEDYSPCKLQSVSNVLNSAEKGSLHFFVVPWQQQRGVESAHFSQRLEFLFLITLILTHVWYDSSAAENLFPYVHNNLFIPHKKAGQAATVCTLSGFCALYIVSVFHSYNLCHNINNSTRDRQHARPDITSPLCIN